MYLKGSKWSYNARKKRGNPWRIIVLVLLVAGALYVNQVIVPATPPLFISTPTPTRSPESFVTEADALLLQGKLAQAIVAYNSATKADPRNPSLYITLARLQIYTGNYQDSLKNAENALLINNNNSMAHAVRGWALSFQGNWLDSEASFKQAIALDPNNAIAYAYYAEMLANLSQSEAGQLNTLDNAIKMSKTARDMAPDVMETHRARGIVLEITSNYAEAAQEFEAAITLNPNIGDLHLALGRNYRALLQYDKAIEEFNRANALNPSDPLPNTYISRTYATVGEYAKAIQFAEQAVKASPIDPYMYGNLGVMYAHNAQYRDAVGVLTLAVRGGKNADGQTVAGLPLAYGRIAEYYSSFGLTLARLGQCTDALQISQLMQQGVATDENAVFNALEMIKICEAVAGGNATLPATLVPSETVSPSKTVKVTPTP